MRIQVQDFMSSPVTKVVGKKSVREVRQIMRDKNIHAVPIIQYLKKLPEVEVKIRGIVTNNDLSVNIDEATNVEDVMTPNVHIIHKHSSAQSAAKMMIKHNVHHLVVMDDGKIVGMISSLDFVKIVAGNLG